MYVCVLAWAIHDGTIFRLADNFLLRTELWAVIETSVISQGTYFSDICQVIGVCFAWYSKKCLQQMLKQSMPFTCRLRWLSGLPVWLFGSVLMVLECFCVPSAWRAIGQPANLTPTWIRLKIMSDCKINLHFEMKNHAVRYKVTQWDTKSYWDKVIIETYKVAIIKVAIMRY